MACLLTWATPSPVHAGAWAPKRGKGYVKLWAKYFWGYGYIDGQGESHDLAGYHELFLATYGDVGLGSRVALWWHTDLLRTFVLVDPLDGSRETFVGPGDPALGLRWQWLAHNRWAASIEAGVRAPLAKDSPQAEVLADEAGNPQVGELLIGAGVWDVIMSVALGYGFDAGYLAGALGITARTGEFDDVVTFSLEGGGQLMERWAGRIRVTGHLPWDNGDAPRSRSPSGIGNGTSYLGFAIETDVEVAEDWFLGLTVEGGLGRIRRLGGGPVVSLGVSTKF